MKKTGIADVDALLASTGLDAPVMKIDKAMFDGVILPLLTDTELLDGVDSRFEQLQNIWKNYFKDSMSDRMSTDKGKNISNALFHRMAIIDIDGTQIDITPPLLEPFSIEGATNLSLGSAQSPEGLSALISRMMLKPNSEWITFLNRYGSNGLEAKEEDNGVYGLQEE